MIRGTTPTHSFELPFDTEIIDKVKIVYAQDDIVIFEKKKEACACDGNLIEVCLSQEETLRFDCKKNVQIQIEVKTKDGKVLKSEIISVFVGKCLDDEVL